MEFEISHQGLMYEALKLELERFRRVGSIGSIQEEEGKSGLSFPGLTFNARSIDLPEPLQHLGLLLKSRANFYALIMPIITTGAAYLEGLSDNFEKAFCSDRANLRWVPVDNKGVGYILNKEETTPLISIARFSTDGSRDSGRVISLGDHGTKPRQIEKNSDDFCDIMGTMQRIAQVYVNSVYEINGRKPLPDITLCLDCII